MRGGDAHSHTHTRERCDGQPGKKPGKERERERSVSIYTREGGREGGGERPSIGQWRGGCREERKGEIDRPTGRQTEMMGDRQGGRDG